jgi:signal peptidase I
MIRNFPEGEHYIEPTAVGTWFRNPGVRETIESILIAVLLALLFRFFEAEAYVIPTGSMAPDLQGRHIDVICPECGFDYRAGASEDRPRDVTRVACPICQHPMTLQRSSRRDHRPFSGDRILVSKFAYDFGEPQRWDVIVFKYPNNGKQNFIKRLIGLPHEGILIEHGDIYAFDRRTETFADRRICRKSPRKQKAMLQLVDDTDHIARSLLAASWPSRWQQWNLSGEAADWQVSEDYQRFTLSNPGDETRWLRYRHLRPRKDEWDKYLGRRMPELPPRMRGGSVPPGELITDHYAYNDTPIDDAGNFSIFAGLHWVGDLAVEAEVDIKSASGSLLLELVEGGIRYQCQLDVASGQATFQWVNPFNDDRVTLTGETTCATAIRGAGRHAILFANSDDKLFLWVDGKFAGGCEYSRTGEVVPRWSSDEPGDAEPVGIGGRKLEMEVGRLRVLRDIYYTSKNLTRQTQIQESNPSVEYTGRAEPRVIPAIWSVLRQPARWSSRAALELFASRNRDESWVFPLEANQYLPMGDNSPQSNDARTWDGARFIDGSYLLGEALFIYWPHAKTSPLPFWPNFGRMKFIR